MAEGNILITGGAGFIGSHVLRLFVNKYPGCSIYNLDKLTYAGNLENLSDLEQASNYRFVRGDICDAAFIDRLFAEHKFDAVLHLAAESHVDRSISDPMAFIETNVIGTVNLLNACRKYWEASLDDKLFYHVSTDEVYGSLDDGGFFLETTPYDPKSPYSASKASADHLVRAYGNTYRLPYVLSNCSNNYGPNQFPEKLIPLCIQNIMDKKPLPLYGKGENVRDWLYVVDHARAIDAIFHRGARGETYNIGGFNARRNIDVIHLLCSVMDKKLGREAGESAQLIRCVPDRAGHDLRYAIDAAKLSTELGWKPSLQFEEGIELTVDWYLANREWLAHIASGAYRSHQG